LLRLDQEVDALRADGQVLGNRIHERRAMSPPSVVAQDKLVVGRHIEASSALLGLTVVRPARFPVLDALDIGAASA
jgi:hypothetical protein